LNIIRVLSPEISGSYFPLDVDCLAPYSTVHQLNRLIEVELEKHKEGL
jgi:hypothetical protein